MFGWLKRKKPAIQGGPAPSSGPIAASAPSTPPTERQAAQRAVSSGSSGSARRASSSRERPRRRRIRAQGQRSRAPDLALDYNEPPPRIGLPSTEIGSHGRRAAIITHVHPGGRRLVARIKATGEGRTYVLSPDGTYRVPGRANAPRLVIGMK